MADSHLRQLSKLYNYLLNVSIVTRWTLFIIPVLAILWIPGILGFTKFPDGRVSVQFRLDRVGVGVIHAVYLGLRNKTAVLEHMVLCCVGR